MFISSLPKDASYFISVTDATHHDSSGWINSASFGLTTIASSVLFALLSLICVVVFFYSVMLLLAVVISLSFHRLVYIASVTLSIESTKSISSSNIIFDPLGLSS